MKKINEFKEELTALISENKMDSALALLDKELESEPKNQDFIFLKGVVLNLSGDFPKSEKVLTQAIEINSNRFEYWNELGLSFRGQNKIDQALQALKKSNSIEKNYNALINLGDLLMRINHLNEAFDYYQQALLLNKNDYGVLKIMGMLKYKIGDPNEAINYLKASIELEPRQKQANLAISSIYHDRKDFFNSLKYLEKEVEVDPENPKVLWELGNRYLDIFGIEKATEFYRQATINAPRIDRYNYLLSIMHHHPGAINKDFHEVAKDCYEKCIKPYKDQYKRNYKHLYNRKDTKKIRIGLISKYFFFGKPEYWVLDSFKEINKEEFELYIYYDHDKNDETTEGYKKIADKWLNTSNLNTDLIADQIYEDQIDILIDLIGHSGGARLNIFGLKPAPIQVSWLNYFGTMGMPEMDYVIADVYSAKEGVEKDYTEEIYRLPKCFFSFKPKIYDIKQVKEIPYKKNGFITFGSLNRHSKINHDVINNWSQILNKVSNSKLVIAAKPLESEDIQNYLKKIFSENGISEDRLILESFPDLENFFLKFNEIDISLDPFPFNGASTTLDSIFMGVPSISLVGDTWVNRCGLHIWSNLDCNELLAYSKEEYVNKTIELANDSERLQKYRDSLRQKLFNSAFMDYKSFSLELEKAFKYFYEEYSKRNAE